MKKKKQKKPYTAPEVVCIVVESCVIMATSDKTVARSNIVLEETEEDATPTNNTFNVW
jgi:hypothetical protein